MGSGSRLKFSYNKDYYFLGISITRFPFKLTIAIGLIFFCIEIGLGKAYDG